MNYLDEAFAKIKPLRNLIAHQGTLTDANFAMLTAYQLIPYDIKEYEERLRLQISYKYIFRENQSALKQTIITLLLMLEEDFNKYLSDLPKAIV